MVSDKRCRLSTSFAETVWLMIGWWVISLLLVSGSAESKADEPSEKEKDGLVKAAIQGYLSTRESFKFLKCRCIETLAQARSVEDALAGKFIKPAVASRVLVMDGKKILHKQGFEPDPADRRVTKLPGGVVVESTPFASSGYLGDGTLRLKHTSDMQVVNLVPPEMPLTGICLTPLAVGDASENFARSPAFYLRESDNGKYKYWPEGYQSIDGRLVIAVAFGNSKGQRIYDVCLDPDRGFLPYRSAVYDIGKNRVDHYEYIAEARKCTKDRWFPIRSVNITLPDQEGDLYTVREKKVVELEVDKRPAESDFTLEVPAGTSVFNPARPLGSFRLKQAEKINVNDLPKLFEMADKAAGDPLMDTGITRSNPYSWLNWVGFSSLVLLVGWVAFSFYRRRGRRPALGT